MCAHWRHKSTCWFVSSVSTHVKRTWWDFASFAIQNASSENSEQTALMCRLTWITARRACPKLCFLMLQLIPCPCDQDKQTKKERKKETNKPNQNKTKKQNKTKNNKKKKKKKKKKNRETMRICNGSTALTQGTIKRLGLRGGLQPGLTDIAPLIGSDSSSNIHSFGPRRCFPVQHRKAYIFTSQDYDENRMLFPLVHN